MQAMRWAVRLAVLVPVLAAVALLALPLFVVPSAAHPSAIVGPDGAPMHAPTQPGVQKATWSGQPVLVIAVDEAVLAGAERVHGAGSATPSVAAGNLRVLVLSSRSTQSGCFFGGLNPTLGEDYDGDLQPDGVLLDPCHQGTWDPYWSGRHLRGPGSAPIAALDVKLGADGVLRATQFDGPVGRVNA